MSKFTNDGSNATGPANPESGTGEPQPRGHVYMALKAAGIVVLAGALLGFALGAYAALQNDSAECTLPADCLNGAVWFIGPMNALFFGMFSTPIAGIAAGTVLRRSTSYRMSVVGTAVATISLAILLWGLVWMFSGSLSVD